MCTSLASWAVLNHSLQVPRHGERQCGTALPLCGPVKSSADFPAFWVMGAGSLAFRSGGHGLLILRAVCLGFVKNSLL